MTKEALEEQKLGLEVDRLQRERRRGDRPPIWDVVKSLGIFVPLAFIACGYCQSVDQDRQAQLQRATEVFLEDDSPAMGGMLLKSWHEQYCGPRELSSPTPCRDALVERILVAGIDPREMKPR